MTINVILFATILIAVFFIGVFIGWTIHSWDKAADDPRIGKVRVVLNGKANSKRNGEICRVPAFNVERFERVKGWTRLNREGAFVSEDDANLFKKQIEESEKLNEG